MFKNVSRPSLRKRESDALATKNLSISHKPLCKLTLLAIGSRLFYLIIIDMPKIHNAAWLATAAGALFSLPVVLAAYILMRKYGARLSDGVEKAVGSTLSRAFYFIAAIMLAYDASLLYKIIAGSAAYATLYDTPASLLIIPTALACTLAAATGGNGAAGTAGAWLRIAPFLYVIVLLWQYKSTNLTWLMPILGPGVRVICQVGLSAASYFCMIPIAFLVGTGEVTLGKEKSRAGKPSSVIWIWAGCAVAVMLLSAVHTSMYPTVPEMTDHRAMQLDLLLSNGKSNRAIQLPMLLIWYGTLAVSTVFMIYVSGRLLALALNRNSSGAIYFCGALALPAAMLGFSEQQGAVLFASSALFVLGGFMIIACVASFFKRRRSRCA